MAEKDVGDAKTAEEAKKAAPESNGGRSEAEKDPGIDLDFALDYEADAAHSDAEAAEKAADDTVDKAAVERAESESSVSSGQGSPRHLFFFFLHYTSFSVPLIGFFELNVLNEFFDEERRPELERGCSGWTESY